MADDANGRVDARYKEAYLTAYRRAVHNVEQGASVEELQRFMADELEPWARNSSPENRFVPAPSFNLK